MTFKTFYTSICYFIYMYNIYKSRKMFPLIMHISHKLRDVPMKTNSDQLWYQNNYYLICYILQINLCKSSTMIIMKIFMRKLSSNSYLCKENIQKDSVNITGRIKVHSVPALILFIFNVQQLRYLQYFQLFVTDKSSRQDFCNHLTDKFY